jgi:hypothetical protein
MNPIKAIRELASKLRVDTFPVERLALTGPSIPFMACSDVTAGVECEKYLLALASKNQRLGVAIDNYYIALFPIDENKKIVGQAMTVHGETADIEQLATYITFLLKHPPIATINR